MVQGIVDIWRASFGLSKKSKYSEEQKQIAVNHYFEYGQCYARTIRLLGYPNRESLRQWCEELAPGARKLRKVRYS